MGLLQPVQLIVEDFSQHNKNNMDIHHLLKSMINSKPRYLPKTINSFQDLNLKEEVLSVVEKDVKLNPVDKKVIWPLISSTVDICVQTSLSATLCYSIAIFEKLSKSSKIPSGPECIVILPVRELALSASARINYISQNMSVKVCTCVGGSSLDDLEKLIYGANILVGTPGRLCYLVESGVLHIENIKLIVLDSLDSMLEMGFKNELDLLIAENNSQLFVNYSKFIPGVQNFCERYLKDPIRFIIENEQ